MAQGWRYRTSKNLQYFLILTIRKIFIKLNYESDVTVLQTIKIALINQMTTEVELLDANIKADLARKPVNTSFKKKIFSAISTIRDPGVWKPLIIINIFNMLQLSSGTYIIVFYAVDMIKDLGEKEFQYHSWQNFNFDLHENFKVKISELLNNR